MLRRLIVAFALVAAAMVPGADAHGAGLEPSINATPTVAVPGTQVLVRGSNFPPGQLVRLAVCGNQAARGAMDCAQEASQIVPPTQGGTFQTPIPIVVPPKPCPCVIQAGGPSLTTPVLLPIQIPGVPTAPVQVSSPKRAQTLRVVDADVSGVGPVGAWFGGPPRRTLALTLRNAGDAPLTLPAFTLMRGRGSHPTTIVDAVELGTLEPGQIRTYRVPVTFDPVAVGSFTVRGAIMSQGRPVTFKATTHAVPWGLLVLAVGVAQLVLVWMRNRGRAVLLRHEPVAGLEPLLADGFDPLDYWGWWIAPAPRAPLALAAGPPIPVEPWCVDLTGAAWKEPIDLRVPEPVLVLTDDEPRWEIALPELPSDFRVGEPRHARRHGSARRGRHSSERES